MTESLAPDFGTELGQIATEWSLIFDPVEFVERYSRAIQKYLLALVKNREDADEVAQDFFLLVTKHGFPRARRDRGRFRDYLKVAVRNAAFNYLQRSKPCRRAEVSLSRLPALGAAATYQDQEWLNEWRECLLNRAWLQLEKIQDRSRKNIYYTALRVTAAGPNCDSATLAARASMLLGRTIRPVTFRKQVSRGRRLFSELLAKEIAQTLDKPTPDQIEEELADLGLMDYVRTYLPPGWYHRAWHA